MPAFAPAALATAVALSALGAVALCGLVVLYGFTPAGEEPPGQTARRLLITRVGHALAAACFTSTAILIAAVLVRPAPASTPAPVTVPDARVPALGAQVAGQETRLTETEVRLQALEDAMRRRAPEVPPAVAPRVAPQPPAPPPRTSAVVKPLAPRPAETKVVEPPAPAAEVVASRVVEPAAHGTSPASPSPGTPTPPTTWVPSSPPPPVITSPAPTPSSAHVPPSSPPVAAAPRPAPPEASASPARPAPRQSFDLWSKLREDWREIRRGLDSTGDDFRRAIDSVKRNFE